MKTVQGYAIKDDNDVYTVSTDIDLIYETFIDFLTNDYDCVIDDNTIDTGKEAFKDHMNEGGLFWTFFTDNGWDFLGIEEIELAGLGIQPIEIIRKK